jgi:hypothetical protein
MKSPFKPEDDFSESSSDSEEEEESQDRRQVGNVNQIHTPYYHQHA